MQEKYITYADRAGDETSPLHTSALSACISDRKDGKYKKYQLLPGKMTWNQWAVFISIQQVELTLSVWFQNLISAIKVESEALEQNKVRSRFWDNEGNLTDV